MSSQKESSSESKALNGMGLSGSYTSPCFHKALRNLGINASDFQQREAYKPEIDREYIRLVRTLPEWMLSDILADNEEGYVMRADSTIEEILDELALRAFLKRE